MGDLLRGLVPSRLREIRAEKKLPQWMVSAGSGVDTGRLSILERGCPPRQSEVEKLTRYFSVAQDKIWPEGLGKGKNDGGKKAGA